MKIDAETKMADAVAQIDDELANAAMVAAKDVLDIKEGESVLIITNPEPDVYAISQAMYDAAMELGGKPVIMIQPYKTQLDFAEPVVIGALGTIPDVAISLSAEKLGKDRDGMASPYVGKEGREYDHVFDFHYREKRMRSFWSPSISRQMFCKTVPIDYAKLRSDCASLKAVLDRAEECHVVTEKGMDLTIGLRGRKADSDDGDFRIAGKGGNLPAGEVYVSPELGSSSGLIVFDGSISATEGEIIIDEPIRATVEGNFVTRLDGGVEAQELEKALKLGEDNAMKLFEEGKFSREKAEEYAKNARNLGELGIGLNRKASIVGNMLEDEKVFSTCHIAIGANYDDDAKALIHLDGLIKEPTISVTYPDGSAETIMKNGALANKFSG